MFWVSSFSSFDAGEAAAADGKEAEGKMFTRIPRTRISTQRPKDAKPQRLKSQISNLKYTDIPQRILKGFHHSAQRLSRDSGTNLGNRFIKFATLKAVAPPSA
jgi:hypothetical protein